MDRVLNWWCANQKPVYFLFLCVWHVRCSGSSAWGGDVWLSWDGRVGTASQRADTRRQLEPGIVHRTPTSCRHHSVPWSSTASAHAARRSASDASATDAPIHRLRHRTGARRPPCLLWCHVTVCRLRKMIKSDCDGDDKITFDWSLMRNEYAVQSDRLTCPAVI